MSEKEFDVDLTLNIPTKYIKKYVLGKIVILQPDIPNWLVLTNDEYSLYKHLSKNNKILDSLIYIKAKLNFTESKCINLITTLISKIDNASFYNSPPIIAEEHISTIKKKLQINLTSDCNIKCTHCYLSAGKKNALHLDCKKVINLIKKINRSDLDDEVVISGGEPLLYKDINYIFTELKRMNFNVLLFSNGTLINKNNIQFIKENVSSVQLSMEGISEKYFEIVRGLHTYKKLINAIELLKIYNIKLVLAITIMDNVIDDVEENLLPFIKSLNYSELEVRINSELEKKGNALDLPVDFFNEKATRKKRVNKIIQELTMNGFYFSSIDSRRKQFNNCGIGSSIVINPDGKIYPCNEFSIDSSLNIEDIKPETLIPIFNELNNKTAIKEMSGCDVCELRYICCGGCKVKNKYNNKSYLIPTCNKLKIYEQLVLDEQEF